AAVGERRPVAHHVPAHVAARALEAHVAIARRRLEVARHLRNDGPAGKLLQALADDLAALLHLADADDVAVEAVADRPHFASPDRHVELEVGVDRVRLVAPHAGPDPRAT